ncbi:hypothetical protein BDD12DRAFT_806489 [Trichophaea hybrida]|nr:hypothetical protein BDD12DRAFT_806489 [Trichophaea hybrida]
MCTKRMNGGRPKEYVAEIETKRIQTQIRRAFTDVPGITEKELRRQSTEVLPQICTEWWVYANIPPHIGPTGPHVRGTVGGRKEDITETTEKVVNRWKAQNYQKHRTPSHQRRKEQRAETARKPDPVYNEDWVQEHTAEGSSFCPYIDGPYH